MGRSKGGSRDLDLEAKLKAENRLLKRQIKSLRKQLDRVDLDRFENLKNLVDKQARETDELDKKSQDQKLKQVWACRDCGEGYLQLMIINRRDGAFYFRKCSNIRCNNRTTLKKYTKDIKGVE